MKNLEPLISKPKIIEFYNKCFARNEKVTADAICLDTLNDVIMVYKLGGHGKEFFGPYLESVKAQYKELKKNRK